MDDKPVTPPTTHPSIHLSPIKNPSSRLRQSNADSKSEPDQAAGNGSKSPHPDQESWSKTLESLAAAVDPTNELNKIAKDGILPPVGEVTRSLLLNWIKAKPHSGGSFKTGDVYGFGVGGSYEEPFLSIVLGRDERKLRVLEDVKINDPEGYQALIVKLRLVADAARKKRPKIKSMGVPPEGKAMLNALYTYGENLLTDVSGADA